MKKELGIFVLLRRAVRRHAAHPEPHVSFASEPDQHWRTSSACSAFSASALGLVIITGGIDLSVGSMFALTRRAAGDGADGMALAVAAGGRCSCSRVSDAARLAHGLLITRVKMQPFIVTLCGLLIYRGMARFIAARQHQGFRRRGRLRDVAASGQAANCFGVPMPFVILIVHRRHHVVRAASLDLRPLPARRRPQRGGRALFRHQHAARHRQQPMSSPACCTGISGILFAFYTNSISPSNHGNFYELYGIAAAVLGGCSLRGGEGSIIGIVIGTALLQVLQNLVNLLGIRQFAQFRRHGRGRAGRRAGRPDLQEPFREVTGLRISEKHCTMGRLGSPSRRIVGEAVHEQ